MGFMGAVHATAYKSLPGVSVSGYCGTYRKGAGNFEKAGEELDLSDARQFPSWRELVADPSIDVVDICLPSDLHVEVAETALKNGKHVLCEKPLALSEEGCERLLRVASESGRVFMVGQVLRFWPEYVYLQKWARSGEFGRVRSAVFTRRAGVPAWSSWLTDDARSGGAVVDLLVHDIDQILLLMGQPERVTAKSMGGEDSVAASFLYPSRSLEVRLQGGWFAAGSTLQMSFQVRAERGLLEFAADGLWLSDANGKRERIEVAAVDGFADEVAYFVECCKNGARPERCLPEESATAVKVALRVKESRAKEGEQVAC
jgi:predicted dehydrogenase